MSGYITFEERLEIELYDTQNLLFLFNFLKMLRKSIEFL